MTTGKDGMPGPDASRKRTIELLVILALYVAVYVVSARYDLLEAIVELSHQYEAWQVDELITVAMFAALSMAWFSRRRWTDVQRSERLLLHRNHELMGVLAEIKQLRGILPICSSCKKIRDDKGYWHQVEVYIRDRTAADFSHSICPDCMKRLYPEFAAEGEAGQQS